MTQDEYVQIVKSALLSLLKNSVMTKLVAVFPIFATGPLNFCAAYIFEKILSVAVNGAELVSFYLYIDFRVSRQGRAFLDAAQKNQNAKTPEEKKNAEQNLIDSARNLIRLGN